MWRGSLHGVQDRGEGRRSWEAIPSGPNRSIRPPVPLSGVGMSLYVPLPLSLQTPDWNCSAGRTFHPPPRSRYVLTAHSHTSSCWQQLVSRPGLINCLCAEEEWAKKPSLLGNRQATYWEMPGHSLPSPDLNVFNSIVHLGGKGWVQSIQQRERSEQEEAKRTIQKARILRCQSWKCCPVRPRAWLLTAWYPTSRGVTWEFVRNAEPQAQTILMYIQDWDTLLLRSPESSCMSESLGTFSSGTDFWALL